MSRSRRVISADDVAQARRRGRVTLEVLPGDIVTALANETAERLGVRLLDGPLARPTPVRTRGATATQRALYRRGARWMSAQPARRREAAVLGKVALVGAGGVGANIAQLAASDGLCHEIALVDVVPGLAESIALDLEHASGISRSATRLRGGTRLSMLQGADVVVVTAGRPRTPGMSRADLVAVNRKVIRATGDAIRTQAPDAVVIVVTNPLDEMTTEMLHATGFSREQVLGMAGTLDSSRFRHALARAASVAPADVEAITLGSHGDEMAPIVSRATIKGRPLEVFLSADAIEACVSDAITGGGQVVALRRTGSATIAPAHAVVEVIDHMRGARAGAVPVSVMLDGEYGIRDVVLGVPCQLGASGLVCVDEVALSAAEHAALTTAAEAIRARIGDGAR